MCQPRNWWLGLMPLAALWIAALAWLTPEIESDLAARVETTVARTMPWARAAIEGRDVLIEGLAPSESAQINAVRTALMTEGVRLASADAAEIAPVIKPFTWGASRDGGKVTLSGHVEADGMRAMLVAEARKVLPNTTVVDEMTDARGAPPNAVAMASIALSQLAKLKSGSIALSDNLLSIKGSAVDAATAAAVTAAAKQLPSTMQLAAVDVSIPPLATGAAAVAPAPAVAAPKGPVLPVERPYSWQAVRDGNVITLTGFAPSEAVRLQAVAAARSAIGNGLVIDQLKLASGVPAGLEFGAATTFSASQLTYLRAGTARLTDNALVIEGQALDAASYRAVATATSGTLPGGLMLDRAELTPAPAIPYTWQAVRTPKALRFDGHYPDEQARRAMVSALQRFPNNLALEDNTSIASAAPMGFTPAMTMGLELLARLEQGETVIAKGQLTISGSAPSERVANELKELVAKVDGGMKVVLNISVGSPAAGVTPAATSVKPSTLIAPAAPSAKANGASDPAQVASPALPPATSGAASPGAQSIATPSLSPAAAAAPQPKPAPAVAAACAAELAASISAGRIQFQSANAVILPASQPRINQIADVMKRCPAMRIEIAGHTDASGSPGFNETLSKGRADAVAARLVQAGIDKDRIQTMGFGSSKPLADNAALAGRRQNRRIEFNVVE